MGLSFIEQVKALNITNSDFNISKAEIEIANDMEKQKMICNMKYKKSGIYLISLRSQAGIEAARIFITKDTILINDRINKRLYYGEPNYLLEKYGITTTVLPVVLGDFISDKSGDKIADCDNGKTVIIEKEGVKELEYTIDCRSKKVTEIRALSIETGKGIIIRFEKFNELEESIMPKNIVITDKEEETRISIIIEKIENKLESDITFIPGKNYEAVLLR
ncbi:MAG: DUF4292 domain-containing protein [Bacteroidia bacterium]|nr:DUF4292 domain-containing protein [Bacteroidia bacterium]